MKRTALIAAIIFALAAATPALAQISESGVVYDLTGTLALPMEDGADLGIGIGSDVFFWTPSASSPIQVGGRFALNFITGDADGTVWEFLPTCRYWLPSNTSINFFLQGSLGLYHARAEGYSDTDLGIGLGGGAKFSNNVFIMPVVNISDFDYFSINVGKQF